MRKILYLPYQILIGVPIALVITIMTALITVIGGIFGNNRIWGYYPGKIWGKLMCWIFLLPVKVEGQNNIKKGESYIIIANHQGAFDTFLIYGFVGVNFKWLIKQEIRKFPLVGLACKLAGHIFIDRGSKRKSQESLKVASNVLKDGLSMTIFPEGTRSVDGKMGRFKKGAFQLAEELQLPLLPVTINGSYYVMPRNAKSLNWHKMSIKIHAPIPPKGAGNKSEEELLEQMRQSSAEAFRIISDGLEKY